MIIKIIIYNIYLIYIIMPVYSNGRKTSFFKPSGSGSGSGMRRVLLAGCNNGGIENHYIAGSTVGAQSIAVRNALRIRATGNCSGNRKNTEICKPFLKS
jgi:hypothetical protein